jgi:predicted outer membrane lipoprotein
MYHRLYQFGHDLDPTAPIRIPPFTPPPLGTNQIAQFATYSYFSWGTFLPLVAALLIVTTLWLDVRDAHRAGAPR